MKVTEQIILTAPSAGSLNHQMKDLIEKGWNPQGGHKVVEKHCQLRYAGMQHKDTTIELEYSQTMYKL